MAEAGDITEGERAETEVLKAETEVLKAEVDTQRPHGAKLLEAEVATQDTQGVRGLTWPLQETLGRPKAKM